MGNPVLIRLILLIGVMANEFQRRQDPRRRGATRLLPCHSISLKNNLEKQESNTFYRRNLDIHVDFLQTTITLEAHFVTFSLYVAMNAILLKLFEKCKTIRWLDTHFRYPIFEYFNASCTKY